MPADSNTRNSEEAICALIAAAGLVPVIALDNAADAVPLCHALKAGGLEVAEITFRTPAARQAIANVAAEFPAFALGAGTVTHIEEVEAAVSAGAGFAVAPGFNPKIVSHARKLGLPFFPGVCTPTEIEAALEAGCTTLKFFPVAAMGGAAALAFLLAPYKHRQVRFVASGGIDSSNVADYLKLPPLLAVGGSWFVPKPLLEARDWPAITLLTREAITARNAARGKKIDETGRSPTDTGAS